MSASIETLPAVRTAFERLIDYAGLFPPAKLDMGAAVSEYPDAKAGRYAWMLGRFIVPASRLKELTQAIGSGPAPFALSAIVDAKLEPRTWVASAQEMLAAVAAVRSAADNVRIEALEVPLPALLSKRDTYDATIGQIAMVAQNAGLRDLPIYIEFPRDARWRELLNGAIAALGRARLGAKIRCGGVTAEAFPSVEDVAAFVHAAVAENVPFKATAGLHHPVRHLDVPTGFTMHGFLNVLAAATFARRMDLADLVAVVAEEDAGAFAFGERSLRWRAEEASIEELAAMREHAFVAYGSCSFDEPVDDLTALAILPKAE